MRAESHTPHTPLRFAGAVCRCSEASPSWRRDEARKVFVAMVAELGAGYLSYAAEVLQGALPDKGYTAQVRGYTLHALLEALAQVRVWWGFRVSFEDRLTYVWLHAAHAAGGTVAGEHLVGSRFGGHSLVRHAAVRCCMCGGTRDGWAASFACKLRPALLASGDCLQLYCAVLVHVACDQSRTNARRNVCCKELDEAGLSSRGLISDTGFRGQADFASCTH